MWIKMHTLKSIVLILEGDHHQLIVPVLEIEIYIHNFHHKDLIFGYKYQNALKTI